MTKPKLFTGRLFRAAMALANVTQKEIAHAGSVSVSTVKIMCAQSNSDARYGVRGTQSHTDMLAFLESKGVIIAADHIVYTKGNPPRFDNVDYMSLADKIVDQYALGNKADAAHLMSGLSAEGSATVTTYLCERMDPHDVRRLFTIVAFL